MAAKDVAGTSVQVAPKLVPLKADQKVYEALKAEFKRPEPKAKKLYWCGTLPAHGKITDPICDAHGNIIGKRERTASKLFHPDDDTTPQRWAGKCRYFQNLNVTGIEFPAFSADTISVDDGERNQVQRPGCVMELDDDQVKSILGNSVRRVVREASKNEADEDGKIKPNKRGYIMNCDRKDFSPDDEHDTPIACYVYMVPIDKMEDVPSMKAFFANPPPPLLE